MRVLVVGAGAIGLYFAGRLAAAGNAVTIKARPSTVAAFLDGPLAIERDGSVEEVTGVGVVDALPGHDDVVPADAFDLIVMATKSWQVKGAGREVAHLLAAGGRVLTTQNGVDAPDRLAACMPEGSVLAGTVVVIAKRLNPRAVAISGSDAVVTAGAVGRPEADAADAAVLGALEAAGISTGWAANIYRALWKKLALIASYGGVGVLGDATVGQTRSVPATRELVISAMREVFAVGNAAGARLTDDDFDDISATYLHRFADSTTASMHRDLTEGRPSELEDQNGAVVRHGRRLGVTTPIHETVYASQLPRELHARGASR